MVLPTGDAKVYVQDGGLIARNTADEAGDDVVFTGSDGAKYKLTLADRAPGGGKVLWYRDGGLFNPDGTIAARILLSHASLRVAIMASRCLSPMPRRISRLNLL